MNRICWLFFVSCYAIIVQGQRGGSPPGVPPHYQQPPSHAPHHQPQPIHNQQPPQQQQQQQYQQNVPQPQHVPHQQQHPPQQQPHHHVPVQQVPNHAPQQFQFNANMEHEKAHITEHLPVPIDTSKMNQEELQFHYFEMHDADKNNKLDGCELIKSLIHWHEHGGEDSNNKSKPEIKIFTDDELIQLIDPILSMDDSNRDGYIDYPEFVRAQQKAGASDRQ